MHPNPRERASYMAENFAPLMDAVLLGLWDVPQEPWACIELFTADGHSRGQQLVRVAVKEGVLFFVGFLFPTAIHVCIIFFLVY